MIKKQRITVILSLLIIACVTLLYFFALKPMIEAKSAVSDEAPELLEGESVGTLGRYYMYSSIERSRIESIEVVNEYGTYKFVKNEEDALVIEGNETVAVDETTLAYLVNVCGQTLTKMRVTSDASEEKLREYGLKDPVAYWIITDRDGKQYKVYVGRELLTGGGYYCRFAGRNAVYVIDNTVSSTVLSPIEAYVTPYVMFGVSKDDYYAVNNFTVFRGKEKIVTVDLVDPKDQLNKDALAENIITYPTRYYPNSEKIYNIYASYVALTGESTYKLNPTDEDLKYCGLNDPEYAVSFYYKNNNFFFLASELKEDSYYYVISNIYPEIITKVSKDTLEYLNYGMMDWVSPYLFQYYITDIAEITVESDKADVEFTLTHGKDADGNPTLAVLADNGLVITSPEDVQNFRQFYKTLLSVAVQGYVPDTVPSTGESTEDFIADGENRDLTFTCKTTSGERLTFSFSKFTTRKSAVTVNGVTDFYVKSDLVEKIENDTLRIMNGEAVEAHAKN